MKALSAYAYTHRVQARWFITIAQVSLFAAAMYLGAMFDCLSVTLPAASFFLCVFVALISAFVFRFRRSHYTSRYIALLSFGAAIFFALVFNYNDNRVNRYQTCTSIYGVKEVKDIVSKKEQRKQARKALLKLIREVKKKKPDAGQVVGVIIVLLISIGLLSLVAALSCSLACNGSEGLAYLVALAGTVGVVLLAIWGIRKVTGSKKRPKKAGNHPQE